jgi:hypothetical protein
MALHPIVCDACAAVEAAMVATRQQKATRARQDDFRILILQARFSNVYRREPIIPALWPTARIDNGRLRQPVRNGQ